MESLETKLQKLVLSFFLVILNIGAISLPVFSQSSLASKNDMSNLATMPYLTVNLYSLLDPVPGTAQSDENDISKPFYEYSVKEIKKLAPYVFEGMIFGFSFEYTPSDKTRAVEEYLSVSFERSVPAKSLETSPASNTSDTSTFSLNDFSKNITYSDIYIQDNCLFCTAEFSLTHNLSQRVQRKQSISMKKIHGKGFGKVSDGEKGIEMAFEQAIKNAVRSYAQGIKKNKPKEICGTVILKDQPRIYIKSGKYVVDTDFFIEKLEITDYTVF